MNGTLLPDDPFRLFADCLLVAGVAHLGPEPYSAPALLGKRLGLLNGEDKDAVGKTERT